MKRFSYYLILAFFLHIFFSCKTNNNPVTYLNLEKSEATEIVLTQIIGTDTLGKSIHIYPDKLKKSEKIFYADKEYSTNFESWFFLIDDNYYMDWVHPCRYVFISTYDGKFEIYNEDYYPTLMVEMDTLLVWPKE